MGLLVTLGLGIFIVLGATFVFITKNNRGFVNFSMSLAFSVIIMLLVVDLGPELYEIFFEEMTFVSITIVTGSIVIGYIILGILDKFMPDHGHHHDHEHKHDVHCNNNHGLAHVGIVSAIAVVLHNIIEGMAVYSIVEESFKSGILLAFGIGLHNIPMGMIIASTLYESTRSNKKTIFIIFITTISTFVGGIIMFTLGNEFISETIEGILIGITTGMLIYIAFRELLSNILENKLKKETVIGLLMGTLLIITTLFL